MVTEKWKVSLSQTLSQVSLYIDLNLFCHKNDRYGHACTVQQETDFESSEGEGVVLVHVPPA